MECLLLNDEYLGSIRAKDLYYNTFQNGNHFEDIRSFRLTAELLRLNGC